MIRETLKLLYRRAADRIQWSKASLKRTKIEDDDQVANVQARQPPSSEAENHTGTEDPAVNMAEIRAKVERSFELVPALGSAWRWYDIAYRVVRWGQTSWRSSIISWKMRRRLSSVANFLMAFEQYDRLKVAPRDDPMENIIIPAGEKITQGAIWVAELFPPSQYSRLIEGLEKSGWGRNSIYTRDGTNAEQVMRARQGQGFAWARLGTVASPGSNYFDFEAKQEELPDEFEYIEITASQIGTSVTAIIAFIRLSEQGQASLDSAWHADREPTLTWRGLRRPTVEGRYFTAIHETQRERQRLHDLGRTWLSERCGGFFANTAMGQPVIDYSVFANFDPESDRPTRELGDALRALGLEGDYLNKYTSPAVPGAEFVQADAFSRRNDPLGNCWGIIGSHKKVVELARTEGYGKKPYAVTTLADIADEAVRSFLIHIAVIQYANALSESFAKARDTARSKHQEFQPRKVDQLRRELLDSSLDLPIVARDTAILWNDRWIAARGIKVVGKEISSDNSAPREFDFMARLGLVRASIFQTLLEEDAAYRDVLATASALGASAAGFRLGRRALVVSVLSLIISLTVSVAHQSTWRLLVHWIIGLL